MPEPNALTPSAVDVPDPQVWDAYIATDATTEEDDVFVTIPAFDDDQGWRHGPCAWSGVVNEHGLFFPKRGDKCTVAISATNEVSIITFTPTGIIPDKSIGGDSSILEEEGLGVVVHGEDENAVRPSGFKYRRWIGKKIPLNAVEFDEWIKPE